MNNVKELTQKEIVCVGGGYIDPIIVNALAFKALILIIGTINIIESAKTYFSNGSPPTSQ